MDEMMIEDEYIEKSEIKKWNVDQLDEYIDYHLCDKMEEGLRYEDPNGIILLKQDGFVKVTMGIEASAKYWNHLFSLPSYIEAQKEAIASEGYPLYEYHTDDPTLMVIRYGYSTNQHNKIADIITEAEATAEIVNQKTIQKLVEEANALLDR